MGENTAIGWTDHTFNCWWGCLRVSPGCEHCYAEVLREAHRPQDLGPAKTTARRTFGEAHWREPLTWNRKAAKEGVRRRVFCASMADVFEDHPTANAEREKLWDLIRATPWLDWQLLTKRPDNIARMLPADWGGGYPNVWLGTSVENSDYYHRITALEAIPARVRFLSCEPLLGPIYPNLAKIHWTIVGGESGPKRRPMDLDWVEWIEAACRVHDTAFFMKQDSALKPGQRGRIPDHLWRHEFPSFTGAPHP